MKLIALLAIAMPVAAEQSYSPYVDRNYPENVYWGDTHLHTYLSGDAYSLGTTITPDQAYRFAKGETIRATGGDDVRMRRPLDFLMVADHAENLGALPALVAGDPSLLSTEHGKKFAKVLADSPALPDVLRAKTLDEYNAGSMALSMAKGAWGGEYGIGDEFKREVWESVVGVAEKHNDPGKFTTFAGYEYSSNPPMLHRNVLYLGGPDDTLTTLPYSKYDSPNPENLWAYLESYRKNTGSDVISIPHNSNLSRGGMFMTVTYDGKPISADYARIRSSIEPLVEVTQIKGDSETHPFISPDDEFADHESWGGLTTLPKKTALESDPGKKPQPESNKPKSKTEAKPTARNMSSKEVKTEAKPNARNMPSKEVKTGAIPNAKNMSSKEIARASYARSALQTGLDIEAKVGVNPYKFGMIGATDAHTGLATVDEDNFWGKMGANEPSPYRARALATFSASGYAAVWATENTREAIFAAMKRREVYATTGPRMTLRFFGGWNYAEGDAQRPDIAEVGYQLGVPMGGDLTQSKKTKNKALSFLIRATKDPDGANLDRVQVVKGWRTRKGKLLEKVYDVAWSGHRTISSDGVLPAVGSTVNLADASYQNTIGSPELSVAWTDPDFNNAEAAVYYVRVLQIPTPRWTTYDAKVYGLKEIQQKPPATLQERAYSSPIWYTPR